MLSGSLGTPGQHQRLARSFIRRNFRNSDGAHIQLNCLGLHMQTGQAPHSFARQKLFSKGAIGAVVARFVHTEEVTGSNPVSPTLNGMFRSPKAFPAIPLFEQSRADGTAEAVRRLTHVTKSHYLDHGLKG